MIMVWYNNVLLLLFKLFYVLVLIIGMVHSETPIMAKPMHRLTSLLELQERINGTICNGESICPAAVPVCCPDGKQCCLEKCVVVKLPHNKKKNECRFNNKHALELYSSYNDKLEKKLERYQQNKDKENKKKLELIRTLMKAELSSAYDKLKTLGLPKKAIDKELEAIKIAAKAKMEKVKAKLNAESKSSKASSSKLHKKDSNKHEKNNSKHSDTSSNKHSSTSSSHKPSENNKNKASSSNSSHKSASSKSKNKHASNATNKNATVNKSTKKLNSTLKNSNHKKSNNTTKKNNIAFKNGIKVKEASQLVDRLEKMADDMHQHMDLIRDVAAKLANNPSMKGKELPESLIPKDQKLKEMMENLANPNINKNNTKNNQTNATASTQNEAQKFIEDVKNQTRTTASKLNTLMSRLESITKTLGLDNKNSNNSKPKQSVSMMNKTTASLSNKKKNKKKESKKNDKKKKGSKKASKSSSDSTLQDMDAKEPKTKSNKTKTAVPPKPKATPKPIVPPPSNKLGDPLPLSPGFQIPKELNGHSPLSFVKFDGLCFLFGIVSSNVGQVGQLPDDCVPQGGRVTFTATEKTANGYQPVRVDVTDDGKVWQTTTTAQKQDVGAHVIWDGIMFDTKQGAPLAMVNEWKPQGPKKQGAARHPQISARQTPNGFLCLVSGKMIEGNWGVMAKLPPQCKPTERIILDGNNQDPLRLDFGPEGAMKSGKSPKNYKWASVAVAFSPQGGTNLTVDQSWQTMTKGGYRSPHIIRLGESLVMLSGVIEPKTSEGGPPKKPSHLLGVLPQEFRPKFRMIFGTAHGKTITPIRVDKDGTVQYVGTESGLRSGADHKGPVWLNLNGITYVTHLPAPNGPPPTPKPTPVQMPNQPGQFGGPLSGKSPAQQKQAAQLNDETTNPGGKMPPGMAGKESPPSPSGMAGKESPPGLAKPEQIPGGSPITGGMRLASTNTDNIGEEDGEILQLRPNGSGYRPPNSPGHHKDGP